MVITSSSAIYSNKDYYPRKFIQIGDGIVVSNSDSRGSSRVFVQPDKDTIVVTSKGNNGGSESRYVLPKDCIGCETGFKTHGVNIFNGIRIGPHELNGVQILHGNKQNTNH